jgi:taurine transport system permease protein
MLASSPHGSGGAQPLEIERRIESLEIAWTKAASRTGRVWRPRAPSLTWLLSVASVAAGFVLWQGVHAFGLVSAELLPGPADVARALVEILRDGYRGTTLWQNIFSTLGRCGIGFGLACAVGIPLGLLMGTLRPVSAALDYIIQFMRPLPPLSYLILLILWLGTGNTSKIALLFLTAFPIVVSSAAAGVRATKAQRIQVALALGASRAQIFRYVIFPSALPTIFTGLRIALAAAFSTVVAAELMAASDGLGWMIFSASQFLRNDVIILGILVLGILGLTLSRLLLAADRATVHWRGVE